MGFAILPKFWDSEAKVFKEDPYHKAWLLDFVEQGSKICKSDRHILKGEFQNGVSHREENTWQ